MGTTILTSTENLSREEWLRWRKKGIGGSDVAPILGISKWTSSIDIWLSKTNQKHDNCVQNEAMMWGHILEPIIRDHFREVTGRKVVEIHAILQNEEHPFMIADIDGLTTDDNGEPAVLECKCVSEYKRSEWDNDSIPIYYKTQVEHYLAVTGLSTAYVAALIGGNSFIIREVHADKEMQEMLVAIEADFWRKVVNLELPQPDASDACKTLLDSIYKGGVSEQVILPDKAVEFLDMYNEACSLEEEAKEKKQLASNNLKEILGNYNTAKCQGYTISWKPVTTERLDTKALKEAEPEIYAKYVKSSTSRRFSIR